MFTMLMTDGCITPANFFLFEIYLFFRSLTTSLNSFSQQNLEHSRQRTRMNNTTVSSSNPHAPAATSTAAVENGSPAKKSNGSRSDFASILRKWSAPIPPTLSRKLGRASESPLGKVSFLFLFLLRRYQAPFLRLNKWVYVKWVNFLHESL